jgi:multiple sugar transport system substrate-binding protein
MRSPRLTHAAVGALVLLAVTLAGCAADTDASTGDVIRVQVAGEPEETAVFEAIAAQYMQTHPDRRVEVIAVPERSDHLALLQTAHAAGDPPDVFVINYREYAPFVVRGAIEPVEPLLRSREVDFGAYFPAALEAFTFDGALQCMPQNISSLVVYVNTALFEAADIPPPYSGWTFEEFRATAAALTGSSVHGVYVEPSLVRLAPFVWSNGGEVVDDTDRPTRLALEQPEAREALDALLGLQLADGVMPSAEDLAGQDAISRFMAGKLAMFLSSRRDTPVLREVSGLEWDVVPLPTLREPASILHSDAYCLSSSSQTEAAADFIAFATGREGQTLAALGGRTVPSMRSVARSPSFLSPHRPPAHSKVFLDAIPHLRRLPVLPQWPRVEDAAEEILTRLWYQGDSLEEGLSELEQRTELFFAAP